MDTTIKTHPKIKLSTRMSIDENGRLVTKYSETEIVLKSISTIQWMIAGHLFLITGICIYPLLWNFLNRLALIHLINQPTFILLFLAICLKFNTYLLFLITILAEETPENYKNVSN